jgi:hypothetical protein
LYLARIKISNQCARLVGNAIYHSAILSWPLAMVEISGNERAHSLAISSSPVAWWCMHLAGATLFATPNK